MSSNVVAPAYEYHGRKSAALHPSVFPCLGDVATVNVITGASRRSLFSGAKRYHAGLPVVYTDLPRQIADDLHRLALRGALPPLVFFGSASDAFGETPLVRELALQALGHVLRAGVPVAFRTRGPVELPFLELFGRHRALVHPQVIVSSLAEHAREAFEPDDPRLEQRFETLVALRKAGLTVDVVLKPLVPFLADDEALLDGIFERLLREGVKRVSGVVPTLHASALEALGTTVSPVMKGLLLGAYGLRQIGELPRARGGGPREPGVHVPEAPRQHLLDAVARVARRHRVRFAPCHCSGHDPGAWGCFTGLPVPRDGSEPKGPPQQADLI
jgi:hypothetical protein